MKAIDYETLFQKLNEVDEKDYFGDHDYSFDEFEMFFENLINESIHYNEYSVLGIDIYEYSQFEINKQSLIPFVFDLIYKDAIRFAKENEEIVFYGYDFDQKFIPTGDGGFQIFDQPLQALVFNTIFYTILHTYNASRFYPKLREYIGPVFLRSCISYDIIFKYNSNFFGPAIINNSRILSKDKLNRLLIDNKSYNWFLKNINGVENITEISNEDIFNLIIKKHDVKSIKGRTTFFPPKSNRLESSLNPEFSKFKNCHIQKIGNITSKKDIISIFNLEIQAYVFLKDEKNVTKNKGMIVTIGNLNTSGIE